MLLILTGLCFKIAAVPFHVWAPDVYQGAPTPVTAFLAVGSKAAGFALLVRIYLSGLFPAEAAWGLLFLILSGATLVYGNLGALPQKNLKRLMGYSSIGHAGYMLMGLSAGTALGTGAVLFYLVQYGFSNLCVFLALCGASAATGSDEIRSLSGLHRRSPILSAALFIGLLSLAGIPPLSGFFGKFQLFAAVVERAASDARFYVLAFVAAAAVVVSLYFYLNVGRAIYLEEGEQGTAIGVSPALKLGLYLSMAAVLVLGIFQGPLVEASLSAVSGMGLR
jgi:NADH-quinone oxidoreductase subunit N